MGNRSPGKIRREGRRAFESGWELKDNPYNRNNYQAGSHDSWNDGWKEAEEETEQEYQEEVENQMFDAICPHCGKTISIEVN